MAQPTQCPFCATIAVVADADVVHRSGARRYRCPSCQSIANPARPARRLPPEPPPLGIDDLMQLRARLADHD